VNGERSERENRRSESFQNDDKASIISTWNGHDSRRTSIRYQSDYNKSIISLR